MFSTIQSVNKVNQKNKNSQNQQKTEMNFSKYVWEDVLFTQNPLHYATECSSYNFVKTLFVD